MTIQFVVPPDLSRMIEQKSDEVYFDIWVMKKHWD